MISSAWSLYLTFSFYPSKLTQLSGTNFLGDHGPRKLPPYLQKIFGRTNQPTNQPTKKFILQKNHYLMGQYVFADNDDVDDMKT